jgi:enoyl-CoA hydratase
MSVIVERRDKIAIVRLARPARRNAVDSVTAVALADAFRAFDADEGLTVAVFTGTDEAFCAGADLKALAQGDGRVLSESGDSPMGPPRLKLAKPVIAAIEGPAVAGGLELALWCDLRVAGEGAVFGVFNRRFGVPLVDLGTIRLPRLIGHGRAMDLILTGRAVEGPEALAIGLINRLVPKGRALAEAIALAEMLASFPQTGLRHDRLSAIEQWGLPEKEAIANELAHGQHALACGEALAGAGRFAGGEGRHGKGTGRR